MKRWIAAILMAALLMQLMPMDALASVAGEPLTEEELNTALALAGLLEENVTYHEGMDISPSMNAWRL